MKYHDIVEVRHGAAIMHRHDDRPVNLLLEDVCLPAVAVKSQSLENNITWMQRHADARGLSIALAPHGKTTMTPWIFCRQTAFGAWAIGVGSAWQASVTMQSGARRVLMINQLAGRANMQLISRLKTTIRPVTFSAASIARPMPARRQLFCRPRPAAGCID